MVAAASSRPRGHVHVLDFQIRSLEREIRSGEGETGFAGEFRFRPSRGLSLVWIASSRSQEPLHVAGFPRRALRREIRRVEASWIFWRVSVFFGHRRRQARYQSSSTRRALHVSIIEIEFRRIWIWAEEERRVCCRARWRQ